MTIHFICNGNTFRSRLAEAYFLSLEVPGYGVMSSGRLADRDEDGPICFYTTAVAQAHKIDSYLKPQWDQLTQARLDTGDVTVFMHPQVLEYSSKLFLEPINPIVWNIPDIAYDPTHDDPASHSAIIARAEQIYGQITHNIDALIPTLPKARA